MAASPSRHNMAIRPSGEPPSVHIDIPLHLIKNHQCLGHSRRRIAAAGPTFPRPYESASLWDVIINAQPRSLGDASPPLRVGHISDSGFRDKTAFQTPGSDTPLTSAARKRRGFKYRSVMMPSYRNKRRSKGGRRPDTSLGLPYFTQLSSAWASLMFAR